MNHQEFYFKCKEALGNPNELIKLYTLKANETKNAYYLYTLFVILNNNFINFNPENINYIDILDEAIKLEKINGKYIFDKKSYYELDYNFIKLLSKIDINASNLFACLIAPTYLDLNPEEYMNKINLELLKKIEYDPEYIIYRAYYSSYSHKANYVYHQICLNVLGEKKFEKFIQKPLLKSKVSYHKDYKKIKELSIFDKVSLLKKMAFKMHNEIECKRAQ